MRLNYFARFSVFLYQTRTALLSKSIRNRGSWAWLIAPGVILAFGLCLHVYQDAFSALSYCAIQEHVFLVANKYLNLVPASLWANLTLFGDGTVLISVISIWIVNTPRLWISLFNASALTGLSASLLKSFFNTPRPAGFFDSNQFVITGDVLTKHSLPSGHTMTVFAGLLTLLFAQRQFKVQRVNYLRIAALLLFALVVGLSRVAVGAHWVLDVLYGAGIGWLVAFLGVHLSLAWPAHWISGFERKAGLLIPLLLLALGLSLTDKLLQEPMGAPVYSLAIACGFYAAATMFYRQLGEETFQDSLSPKLVSLQGMFNRTGKYLSS